MYKLPYPMQEIINVARVLDATGRTGASTGEVIAAAFVLNRQDYFPGGYEDMLEAWDRLDPLWQKAVRLIKRDHMHRLD